MTEEHDNDNIMRANIGMLHGSLMIHELIHHDEKPFLLDIRDEGRCKEAAMPSCLNLLAWFRF